MNKNLNLNDVFEYVEENIGKFHKKRIEKLSELKLDLILKRKNPYLFKVKNVLTAEEIIKGLVEAYISSREEAIFGDWLEGLAIFINKKVYGGWKSGIKGIDLEFDREDRRYIVAIKSGPNWGNSSQIEKMITDFHRATKTLRTSNSNINVLFINGCCYGRDNRPFKKGIYYKYCGQRFWEFISGNKSLYTDIIKPLGHKAKEKNEEYMQMYSKMINRFTLNFAQNFCLEDGAIYWKKLVKYNSSIEI